MFGKRLTGKQYVIVGAGPCGLATAWILANHTPPDTKIVIIDREKSIGGCHRVRRLGSSKLFTEHGPRIYVGAYENTKQLLRSMNMKFYDYFVPYLFTLSEIGGKSARDMTYRELAWFAFEFMRMTIVSQSYAKSTSMQTFMELRNFSENTADYVDRLCRLTDGAGIEKYTLFEFLQLVNQNALYDVLQPNKPNDHGLLAAIRQKLINTNKISFMLDTKVVKIISTRSSGSDQITTIVTEKGDEIFGDVFIMAIPPLHLMKVLSGDKSTSNAFGNFGKVHQWSIQNSYNTYIPVTFHWKQKLKLPHVWGFSKTDWGIAWIKLSDYADFESPESHTLISACITMIDRKSRLIGKTPHECSESELKREIFRELELAFGVHLPKPTRAILSPGVFRADDGKWDTLDAAYMMTPNVANGTPFDDFRSIKFRNLYAVGTHCNASKYHFTSFESAISNAMVLCHKLIPGTRVTFPCLVEPTTISEILLIISLLIVNVLLARLWSQL